MTINYLDYVHSRNIYRCSGFSSTIINSFASPDIGTTGIGFNGQDIMSSDLFSKAVYLYSGFSSTIKSSFAHVVTTSGLHGSNWDGSRLITCNYGTDRIYIHSGFSSTISNSFSSPSTWPMNAINYRGNLISTDNGSNTIYIHNGYSNSITTTFATNHNYSTGVCYDETLNVITARSDNPTTNNYVYKHSGFSSTITNSFLTIADGYGLQGCNIATIRNAIFFGANF